MTVNELIQELQKIVPKVEYRAFEEITTAPFIAYYIPRERQYGGDEENLILEQMVVVELYTAKKDFALECKIEDILFGIAFEKEEEILDSDALFAITYTFTLYNEREFDYE